MHQRRLLPLLARTYALHFAQSELVAEFARLFTEDAAEHDRRALEARAAATKALATWNATETIQTCREACGGAGYLAENRFGPLKADTDVFTTFEGDNTILMQLVAKGLLTDYRDAFGALDPLGTARFVAAQAVEIAVEKTALRALIERLRYAVPGRSGGDDPDAGLRDDDYHSGILRFREEHALAGVARRLKRGIDDGDDPFELFNRCQDHVIAAATAHAERVVLEAFLTAVHNAPDDLRDRLKLVYDLHALATIEADRAWFIEHGRLSGERSKAITAMVNRLCGQVREHAVDLVDAFGVPEPLVDVPLLR